MGTARWTAPRRVPMLSNFMTTTSSSIVPVITELPEGSTCSSALSLSYSGWACETCNPERKPMDDQCGALYLQAGHLLSGWKRLSRMQGWQCTFSFDAKTLEREVKSLQATVERSSYWKERVSNDHAPGPAEVKVSVRSTLCYRSGWPTSAQFHMLARGGAGDAQPDI